MPLQDDRARRTQAGFSLIELLVVTVVLGIIMAITIAALANALDKARRGATIADMRNLGTAIEAYVLDHSIPPPSGAGFEQIAPLLRPYHNQIVPVRDHWGHIYDYESGEGGSYSIISYGKDGIDGDDLEPEDRFAFDNDIVFVNGEFPGLK